MSLVSLGKSRSVPVRSIALASLLALAGCVGVTPGVNQSIPWSELPGWRDERPAAAWPQLMLQCAQLGARAPQWRSLCDDAALFPAPSDEVARAFFETRFQPHVVRQADGGETGLITGYYEPLLEGRRQRDARFRHPIYGPPTDLVSIELGSLYPELAGRRLRGRLDGRRVLPYWSRAEIDRAAALKASVLAWVDDPVALFFLQIQGSGRVRLADGETLYLGYADQNGHPYVAIGRTLIDRSLLAPGEVNLPAIRAWLAANPGQAMAILHTNPSYVFFRVNDAGLPGPLGAANVPLLAERAAAVDPSYIALGTPVWLDTTSPIDGAPYRRLLFALDTGGAIKGPVRADVFMGYGERAERWAGHMKQSGRLYVLLPAPRP